MKKTQTISENKNYTAVNIGSLSELQEFTMRKFKYKKINAFSAGKSTGNPAACLYLEEGQQLSDSEMLSIAKEHKGFVSEVVYCTHLNENTFRLKYYSSECEVEFCGHGTIACIYELIKSDEGLRSLPEITIVTNKGELTVYNKLEKHDAVFITAPDPQFLPLPLSITENEVNNHTVELIDARLRTLIVPFETVEHVIGIQPDETELKELCLANGIDIILVFSKKVVNKSNAARSRVFAPKFGYLEDPATGSGNSALGYYMLNHNLWNGEPISIEQNGEIEDYNIVKLKTIHNKVLFGGSAVTKIEGTYYLK